MPLYTRCSLVEYSKAVTESRYLLAYSLSVTTKAACRTFIAIITGFVNKSAEACPVKENGIPEYKFAARAALLAEAKCPWRCLMSLRRTVDDRAIPQAKW